MKVDLTSLPNTVKELTEMIRRMACDHDEELDTLKSRLESERSERIEHQNKALEYFEELQLLRRRLFGRSAERMAEEDRRQLWLFNEAELIASEERKADREEQIAVRSYTRRKRGRKPLPADLPRVVQVHDIAEEEKICGCGEELSQIGEESCEELEIIPARVQVRRHVRPKYACGSCEGSGDEEKPAVRIAPAVPQLLPKSIASPALIAYMLVSKFCDALPFYRQEKLFCRIGIELSRVDFSNWAIQATRQCDPLIEVFLQEIRAGPFV